MPDIETDLTPIPSSEALQQVSPTQTAESAVLTSPKLTWKKVRGGLLFVIGYLLSPLSWWNDLIFNLPVAYGFGYLCSWFSKSWLIPGLIIGYWISNIIGILLMQFGALDVLQGQPKARSLKKELFTGIASSTAYTLVIVALVQFHIIDAPTLLADDAPISLGALLSSVFPRQ